MKHESPHGRLKSLHVERTANGLVVKHEYEPKPAKKKPASGMPYESDYDQRHQEFSFNDPEAAHAHVQQHMAALLAASDGDGADGEPDSDEPMTPATAPTRGRFVKR